MPPESLYKQHQIDIFDSNLVQDNLYILINWYGFIDCELQSFEYFLGN